ncbi:Uncharacterised protein [Yersinia enterocolitica]|nr:Uncharacterised protein [Yersinia enterocolitica]
MSGRRSIGLAKVVLTIDFSSFVKGFKRVVPNDVVDEVDISASERAVEKYLFDVISLI